MKQSNRRVNKRKIVIAILLILALGIYFIKNN